MLSQDEPEKRQQQWGEEEN